MLPKNLCNIAQGRIFSLKYLGGSSRPKVRVDRRESQAVERHLIPRKRQIRAIQRMLGTGTPAKQRPAESFRANYRQTGDCRPAADRASPVPCRTSDPGPAEAAYRNVFGGGGYRAGFGARRSGEDFDPCPDAHRKALIPVRYRERFRDPTHTATKLSGGFFVRKDPLVDIGPAGMRFPKRRAWEAGPG